MRLVFAFAPMISVASFSPAADKKEATKSDMDAIQAT